MFQLVLKKYSELKTEVTLASRKDKGLSALAHLEYAESQELIFLVKCICNYSMR